MALARRKPSYHGRGAAKGSFSAKPPISRSSRQCARRICGSHVAVRRIRRCSAWRRHRGESGVLRSRRAAALGEARRLGAQGRGRLPMMLFEKVPLQSLATFENERCRRRGPFDDDHAVLREILGCWFAGAPEKPSPSDLHAWLVADAPSAPPNRLVRGSPCGGVRRPLVLPASVGEGRCGVDSRSCTGVRPSRLSSCGAHHMAQPPCRSDGRDVAALGAASLGHQGAGVDETRLLRASTTRTRRLNALERDRFQRSPRMGPDAGDPSVSLPVRSPSDPPHRRPAKCASFTQFANTPWRR